MEAKIGIDVSEHQGCIAWDLVKNHIDFAIIRVGYGRNHIDKQFKRNINECVRLNIPVGAYWFSYALSANDAVNEAKYCCEALNPYHLDLPIAFDWEYDSDTNASSNNVVITNAIRANFARNFLNTVKEHGREPMLYTNQDYLNKGFRVFLDSGVKIWLAQWSGETPKVNCYMWQYSSKSKVAGIAGNVDANKIVIKDKNDGNDDKNDDVNFKWFSDKETHDRLLQYDQTADGVISGYYGNGLVRVERLKSAGYDPVLVQYIVNYKMKNG